MKKIAILFLLFHLPSYALSSKEKIEKECQQFTSEEIFGNKAPPCKKALIVYFKKVLDNKIPRSDQGLYAYLFLGLRADIPHAYKIVEKEIYEGHLNDWIDQLRELKTDVYEKSLIKWARHVESEVRKNYNVKLSKDKNYTLNENDSDQPPELMSVWSPVLMTKYLDLLSQKSYHVSGKDFASLNVIYAFSTPSFRGVFRDQTAKIITKASDEWVKSIRKEQSWVLFRIFPLIPKKSDGNIKRELIWLSKYHSDFKIRSLASSSLRDDASRAL